MTKGKLLLIVAVFILSGVIIILPLSAIGFVIQTLIPLLEFLWNIISGIIQHVFYGSLVAIYYYYSKEKL